MTTQRTATKETISDAARDILFKFFNREIQDKYKNFLTSDAKVS